MVHYTGSLNGSWTTAFIMQQPGEDSTGNTWHIGMGMVLMMREMIREVRRRLDQKVTYMDVLCIVVVYDLIGRLSR